LKKLIVVLLSIIFTTLIIGPIQLNTDAVYIEEDDGVKNYWTVLREMN